MTPPTQPSRQRESNIRIRLCAPPDLPFVGVDGGLAREVVRDVWMVEEDGYGVDEDDAGHAGREVRRVEEEFGEEGTVGMCDKNEGFQVLLRDDVSDFPHEIGGERGGGGDA